ncbi:MAG: iron-sulfur cluster assembly scaffold protein [Lentisphaerae bacterium]|jgi:nitrogen fixation NifU-like protein|nr:iron-sulfur cluster assembly scaffold protein [Lentisphaerota bacterium]
MSELYQATLLAHAKQPYGAGSVPRGTEDAEAFHAGCGDEIRVKLEWTAEGRLAGLVHELHGCAVSLAVASMAAQCLEGLNRAEIGQRTEDFMSRLGQAGFDESWGDFQALNGLERYPVRLHCARLVWRAVKLALDGGEGSR